VFHCSTPAVKYKFRASLWRHVPQQSRWRPSPVVSLIFYFIAHVRAPYTVYNLAVVSSLIPVVCSVHVILSSVVVPARRSASAVPCAMVLSESDRPSVCLSVRLSLTHCGNMAKCKVYTGVDLCEIEDMSCLCSLGGTAMAIPTIRRVHTPSRLSP